MQAATRRNLGLVALGVIFLLLLWQVPARRAQPSPVVHGFGTPQPTPTVESRWRGLFELEASGSHDLCREGQEITVPGPWRVRATPTDRAVQVYVYDRRDGRLFARVWAAGLDGGALATLPQGNGTFCLRVEAEGEYTLWVEVWEAPEG
jgi:uncharacterized protein YbdZ (MbtH family)